MSPYTEDCNFSFPCELVSSALLGQEAFSFLVTMTHMLQQTTPHLPAVALPVLLYSLFSPTSSALCSIPCAFSLQHPSHSSIAAFLVSQHCCLQRPCAHAQPRIAYNITQLCKCMGVTSSGVLHCAFIDGAGHLLLSCCP